MANVIKLSLFDPENIQKVYEELNRILSMRGQTEVKTPAVINEEGEITKEEVKQPITITSDILTVATVLEDFPLPEVEEME